MEKRFLRGEKLKSGLALALASGALLGCNEEPQAQNLDAQIVCERGKLPIVTSTNQSGETAEIKLGCTDGKTVEVPLALTENVNQRVPANDIVITAESTRQIKLSTKGRQVIKLSGLGDLLRTDVGRLGLESSENPQASQL